MTSSTAQQNLQKRTLWDSHFVLCKEGVLNWEVQNVLELHRIGKKNILGPQPVSFVEIVLI